MIKFHPRSYLSQGVPEGAKFYDTAQECLEANPGLSPKDVIKTFQSDYSVRPESPVTPKKTKTKKV